MADTSPTTTTADDLVRAAFWRNFAPQLHIGALKLDEPTRPQQSFDRLSRRMLREGYFSDADARLETTAPMIGEAVKKLVAFGLPPTLIWVYDEPWHCFRRLGSVIAHFLGSDYKLPPPSGLGMLIQPKANRVGGHIGTEWRARSPLTVRRFH